MRCIETRVRSKLLYFERANFVFRSWWKEHKSTSSAYSTSASLHMHVRAIVYTCVCDGPKRRKFIVRRFMSRATFEVRNPCMTLWNVQRHAFFIHLHFDPYRDLRSKYIIHDTGSFASNVNHITSFIIYYRELFCTNFVFIWVHCVFLFIFYHVIISRYRECQKLLKFAWYFQNNQQEHFLIFHCSHHCEARCWININLYHDIIVSFIYFCYLFEYYMSNLIFYIDRNIQGMFLWYNFLNYYNW